jgi:outer membrane protein TolC
VRSARGGLRSAKAALASIIGVVDDFDVEPPPPFAALEVQAKYDELVQRAFDNRIDLRMQKQLLGQARRALRTQGRDHSGFGQTRNRCFGKNDQRSAHR